MSFAIVEIGQSIGCLASGIITQELAESIQYARMELDTTIGNCAYIKIFM